MRLLILVIHLQECFHVQTFLRNKYLMDQKPFFLNVSFYWIQSQKHLFRKPTFLKNLFKWAGTSISVQLWKIRDEKCSTAQRATSHLLWPIAWPICLVSNIPFIKAKINKKQRSCVCRCRRRRRRRLRCRPFLLPITPFGFIVTSWKKQKIFNL